MSKKTLRDYGKMSFKKSGSFKCNIELEIEGETWKAYEVSIAHGDLLFFTDKGTLNYVVDRYGDEVRVELFNYERDKSI